YFSTPRRKFIIADAPGHVQYTRNMVTGASNCDLAIILVDARNGVVEQTRRHTYLTSLLGIRHLVVAVNKMDMIGYDEEAFYRIAAVFKQFSNQLNFKTIHFIPVSALHGENIVQGSVHFSWY
ncbi:MAG TPA: GTP-binding protein, partial [Saprospiraceae bacterium]|nr:GTP-binding protein [Saprospiraceae bacterium]